MIENVIIIGGLCIFIGTEIATKKSKKWLCFLCLGVAYNLVVIVGKLEVCMQS